MFEAAKGLFKGKEAPAGSVTKTEKSVTVAPSKKRGGSVRSAETGRGFGLAFLWGKI
jgi:hypothetical protein